MKPLINILLEKLALYHYVNEKLALNHPVNEKLTLNAQSKSVSDALSSNKRNLKRIEFPQKFSYFFSGLNSRKLGAHVDKIKEYYNKRSKPKTLVNTIKNPVKLGIRFVMAVLIGWEDCADQFRQALINRGIISEDAIDKFILTLYKDDSWFRICTQGFPSSDALSLKPNIEKYLMKYNIQV